MKFWDKIKSWFKKDNKQDTNLNQTMDNCGCNDCCCSDAKIVEPIVEPVITPTQEPTPVVTNEPTSEPTSPMPMETTTECCSSCECHSYDNNSEVKSNN